MRILSSLLLLLSACGVDHADFTSATVDPPYTVLAFQAQPSFGDYVCFKGEGAWSLPTARKLCPSGFSLVFSDQGYADDVAIGVSLDETLRNFSAKVEEGTSFFACAPDGPTVKCSTLGLEVHSASIQVDEVKP